MTVWVVRITRTEKEAKFCVLCPILDFDILRYFCGFYYVKSVKMTIFVRYCALK